MGGTSPYLPIVVLLLLLFQYAELSCTFRTERDQNPRIEWKKRGKDVSFVYFDGHFRGPFEGRATIDGATVTLQRVTQDDAGEYRCEISAPLDSVSLGETNVTLKVLVPPHTPSCQIPSTAVTGSVVRLQCHDHQSIPPQRTPGSRTTSQSACPATPTPPTSSEQTPGSWSSSLCPKRTVGGTAVWPPTESGRPKCARPKT
uniref:Junctional adhesion molecule 2a n=1 Tax=Neogobius melanostomus TaxID=47308 RepID=A0A8C6V1V3_9GOBI